MDDTSLRADDIRHDVQDESVLRKFASEVHYRAPKRKPLAGTG